MSQSIGRFFFQPNCFVFVVLESKQGESTVVRLNVGGVVFQTLSTTLTGWKNQKTNFFSALLEASAGDTEVIFIDRDPELFRTVLNYLRTGQLAVPSAQLRTELAFYGLPEPAEWSQPFQQWAMGQPGEIRMIRIEHDIITYAGNIKVHNGQFYPKNEVGWQEPFKSLETKVQRPEHPLITLLREMGKLGWELKAVHEKEHSKEYYCQFKL